MTSPRGNDFVTLSIFGRHGLALREDGTIAAWAQDDFDQVSNVPDGNDFVAVSAGMQFSLALRDDGSIAAWGNDSHGKVSDTPTLQYTIVRPGAFFETHAIELMAEPLRKTGKVKLFGKARIPIRYVSVEDVADYMIHSVDDQSARNAIKVIGGTDVMSRIEVLEVIEWLLGKKAKRSHLPVGVMRVMKGISKPLNPGLSYLIDTVLAEENPSNEEEWAPAVLDWTGAKKVDDVVHRWIMKTG